MTIYLLIILLLFVLSLSYDFRKSSDRKEGWENFILFVLVLLAGFRGDIGNDTMVYHNWYDSLATNPLIAVKEVRFEPLSTKPAAPAAGGMM
jgi:hypothetical protein